MQGEVKGGRAVGDDGCELPVECEVVREEPARAVEGEARRAAGRKPMGDGARHACDSDAVAREGAGGDALGGLWRIGRGGGLDASHHELEDL